MMKLLGNKHYIAMIIGTALSFLLGVVTLQPLKSFAQEYPVTTVYNSIGDTASVKNNFSLSGSATWYNDPWVKLTPDATNQVGSIYSNKKIQTDQDFSVLGHLAITLKKNGWFGEKYNGDGIGLVFHTGNVSQIGNAGSNIGIVGLPNAVGLVLDTYQNSGEPGAPYVGIWKTDAKGVKTVVTTKAISLNLGAYNEITYIFKYTAVDRKLKIQLTDSNNNYVFPATGSDTGGYEFVIPESMLEYAFSIIGATGGQSNLQYSSILLANLAQLKTNTPKITNEISTEDTVKLTLSDQNNIFYPAGSSVYANGKIYLVDSSSSIIIPMVDIADSMQPFSMQIKSFKIRGTVQQDASISDLISYKLTTRKVNMIIQYLDIKDKQTIFSEPMVDTKTKAADTFQVNVGDSISGLITDKISSGLMSIDYTGYNPVEINSYVTNTVDNSQVLRVPPTGVTVTYYYTPQTILLDVPKKVDFGAINVRRLISAKLSFFPIYPLANVKILNTDRTVQWVLYLKQSKALVRSSDAQMAVTNLFYQNRKGQVSIISSVASPVDVQDTFAPYQEILTSKDTNINGIGIGLEVYDAQKDYLGDYSGALNWILKTSNEK